MDDVTRRGARCLADLIATENSMEFHADQEAVCLLAMAISYARLKQAELVIDVER